MHHPETSDIFDTHLASFDDEVIQASYERPILVDFWAEWCAPCIVIAPALKQVIPAYNGRLRLAKLEVDEGENMKLAGHHKVRGFPTVMLFRDGKEVARFSGARPARAIHEFIQVHTELSVNA
ncbi:MAG: thioredoxin [Gammaproteobacteria bacterium]|nr:MAG: thioredoxin [Gammaproteobacteria bacterium]